MKDPGEMSGKQNTSPKDEGCLHVGGVEPHGHVEVLSIHPASESRQNNAQEYTGGLLEAILDPQNLNKAYKRVKANKGSCGVDGMTVEDLLPHLKLHGQTLRQSILDGTYRPSPVRRVEIPKPDGGIRLLGIPTVQDRLIQQAIAQVLTPIFDPHFSSSSYGFRPGRSAKQAVKAAKGYIQDGYTWVVDIDLEKFFDRVNHSRLMEAIARKIKDKRVLTLIRKYLQAGVMLLGVKTPTAEGTPQGGPLSPLLANIVLDDLDKELEKRGHRFCRYADDCNIYVKSQRAGERVMTSIKKYIEKVLKLKVNEKKSAVDKPSKRKFLGFSFYQKEGETGIFVHKKPVMKFVKRVREITARSNGKGMEWRKVNLNQCIRGWIDYFGIADMRNLAEKMDSWIRRRLRMCYWKQWKKTKARIKHLVQLGMGAHEAKIKANTRKGYWRTSNSPILNTTLTSKYLKQQGFMSLTEAYLAVH